MTYTEKTLGVIKYKAEVQHGSSIIILRIFLDPYIAMITLGAVGHDLHKPFFYHISYWTMVLIVLAIQALWGIDSRGYNIRLPKEKKENKYEL